VRRNVYHILRLNWESDCFSAEMQVHLLQFQGTNLHRKCWFWYQSQVYALFNLNQGDRKKVSSVPISSDYVIDYPDLDLAVCNRSRSKFERHFSERFSSRPSRMKEMTTSHSTEQMDETIEVSLLLPHVSSSPTSPHAYSAVLCPGCWTRDHISRESGFVRFTIEFVDDGGAVWSQITDPSQQRDRTAFEVCRVTLSAANLDMLKDE